MNTAVIRNDESSSKYEKITYINPRPAWRELLLLDLDQLAERKAQDIINVWWLNGDSSLCGAESW